MQTYAKILKCYLHLADVFIQSEGESNTRMHRKNSGSALVLGFKLSTTYN